MQEDAGGMDEGAIGRVDEGASIETRLRLVQRARRAHGHSFVHPEERRRANEKQHAEHGAVRVLTLAVWLRVLVAGWVRSANANSIL